LKVAATLLHCSFSSFFKKKVYFFLCRISFSSIFAAAAFLKLFGKKPAARGAALSSFFARAKQLDEKNMNQAENLRNYINSPF
jgi:hypothetical protein